MIAKRVMPKTTRSRSPISSGGNKNYLKRNYTPNNNNGGSIPATTRTHRNLNLTLPDNKKKS